MPRDRRYTRSVVRGGVEKEVRWRYGALALSVVLASFALPAAGASASTICVGVESSGCESSAATVQAALDSAVSSPAADRVVIGDGVFEGPFTYSPGSNGGRIEVVGQGPATVITAPPGTTPATVLAVRSDNVGDGSAVSNLTVRIPANTNSSADTGISSDAVSNVRVASDAREAPNAGAIGVDIGVPGGSVRNSVIEIVGGTAFGVGVYARGESSSNPTVIADSRISAPFGVIAFAQLTTVVRSRILTSRTGVLACNGPVTVEDTLIRLFGGGVGLLAEGTEECGSGQASLDARQVTVVGTGVAGGQTGAMANSGNPGQAPSLEVSLSILRQLQTAFLAETHGAGTTAAIHVGASDFEAGRHAELANGGSVSFAQSEPNIDADPLFTSDLLGEFSLRPGSPAIDSSFSPALAAGESTTDLAGNPRVLDGNGDGDAARDMGAFEAPAVPVPPDTTPPNTVILPGAKHKLKAGPHGYLFKASFTATEAASSFQCRVDTGKFASCSSPFQKRLAAGVHVFEVRAVDAAGNVDPTPAKESIRVAGTARKHHRHGRHRAL